jgi:serine/threonine protein kinase
MLRSIFSFYLSHPRNFLSNKSCLFFQKKINTNNIKSKEVLNGRYEKIKKLGAGAQGTVYEVEDLNENRKK